MAEADRTKWNQRYREGAYAERTHPSALLAEWIDRIPVGPALDVACGAGRNALFLAAHGFAVDAVDISSAALERARSQADRSGLDVHWIEHDLDEPATSVLAPQYALILVIRYVNLPLIRELARRLAPGGFLIVEEHLQADVGAAGPADPAFRVKPGELARLARRLEVLHLEESVITDPDGRSVAVARLVARRS